MKYLSYFINQLKYSFDFVTHLVDKFDTRTRLRV